MIQSSVGPLSVNVADQAIELVGDLRQISFSPALKFGDPSQVSFGPASKFQEVAKLLRLPVFDLSHHDKGILQVLECRLHWLVAHDANLRHNHTSIIIHMDVIEFLQSWYRAQTNGE